ncbi:MAG: 16S rRNA (uracil(1498)-N(3))-methyltransferase [Holosporaceae bacterium]|jgi:16S rRNA (uracil1498-N3)-methyltransferase|nr:16S rRNA (uracil(1498)-N(3))-methyltransferase [Holosporaceae bacterium]
MKHIPRFHCEAVLKEGYIISIRKDQMYHAVTVLQLSRESHVRVFNQQFGEWDCIIRNIKENLVECVSLLVAPSTEKGPIIACSLIKPKKFEFLLEKITELGVQEVIPIISQYTQYKGINVKRYKRIIIEACEQSKRLNIPKLHNTMKIIDFLCKYDYHFNILVGDWKFAEMKLADALQEKCIFLIGPEGGFSNDEYNLFKKYRNVVGFKFGKSTLKSETAAIAFASIWRERFS